ncbi:TetR/AcrR family transcriptional regulator [Shewanella frigidimarina]|uniref:TetR/AcrR family transcriptional regulator n=1 Tax=Shewanella frigidimarina TaxID=56812 RepID=UPI003D7A2467
MKISVLKEPKQQRAKVKVEKILLATKKLLMFHGVEKLTTNHIAEESGVTVGSIYQYFPNKQSILYKIYLDWLNEAKEQVISFKELSKTMAPVELIRALFEEMYKGDDFDSEMHLLEVELIKVMGIYPELKEAEKQHGKEMITLFSDTISQALPETSREKSVQLATFIYSIDSSISQFLELGGSKELVFEWYEKVVMLTLDF